MDAQHFEGGCFCGALRYRFVGVFDAGYCHCSICRRTTGAPVIAWVNTGRASFTLTRGAPKFVATSAEFERAFCDACGTITYTRSRDPGGWPYVSVHHGTIDGCERIEPRVHLCYADRLSWLHIDDDLLKVEGNTLPHPEP
jgi:hypothetical protein